MDPRIGSRWLIATWVGIVMISCCISGVACDVPDDVVYTDLHKTVRIGDRVVLKCQFRGTPLAVYWKKGDNPIRAPTLVSWITGDPATGVCKGERLCRIMEMNAEFSLIIKEVSIVEQGLYVCTVENYKGKLMHNFTDISVVSPPKEPYPIINECQMNSPNDNETTCTISTSQSVEISCSASGYFPDIELYFVHGSTRLYTKETIEDTNLDWTKKKTISTIASASEISYVCFASDIPGLQEQRAASVLVNLRTSSSPMPAGTTILIDKTDGSVAKVVVPVIFIILLAVICISIILWRRRKQQRPRQGKYTMVPGQSPLGAKIEGKISYYELWCLLGNMNLSDLAKLPDAIIELGIIGVEEQLTKDRAYSLLCDWKETNTYENEGVELMRTLDKCGVHDAWKSLIKRVQPTSMVSEERLDHIIRSISEERDLHRFLLELIPDRDVTLSRSAGKRGNIATIKAKEDLQRWRGGMKTSDPNYLLSLALERASCKPLARTFFQVPEDLLKAISPHEVEQFVYRLTGRHCTRLAKAACIADKNGIKAVIDNNNEDLFDTRQMINAWLAGQECSNYEKRCRFDDAIIRIGRHDMTDFFKTTYNRVEKGNKGPHSDAKAFNSSSVFNDDLAVLLKHLPSDAMHLFFEKLGIAVNEESDDLEKRLRDWRDKRMSDTKACALHDLLLIYQDVLNDIIKVTDGELKNLVENIPSEHVQDLTSRLGIDITNERNKSLLQHLKVWRDNHGMGTCREALRKALHEMELSGCIVDQLPPQHVYQAEVVRLAYSILYKDVEPLATLLGMDTSRRKGVQKADKGTVGLLIDLLNQFKDGETYRRRDFCVALGNLGYLDAARLAFFGYEVSLSELSNITSPLQKVEMETLLDHLQADKAGRSVRRGTMEPYDNLKLIMVLKNQLRTEPFHYRLKLAVGLKAIQQPKIAYDVLAGKYRTSNVNSDVVESICKSLDVDTLKRLCGEIGRYDLMQESHNNAAKGVAEWVKKWLERFDKTPVRTVRDMTIDKFTSRRLKNDELFRAGSFELAEEIMIVEYPRFPSD